MSGSGGADGAMTIIVALAVWVVVVIGVYIWYALALSMLFERLDDDDPRAQAEPWRAWVPFVNVAEVLRLGGYAPWLVVLFVIPFVDIYAVVIHAIAATRIHRRYGYGVGMTVLAVVLPPVWATVLGWGKGTARVSAVRDARSGAGGVGRVGVPGEVGGPATGPFAPPELQAGAAPPPQSWNGQPQSPQDQWGAPAQQFAAPQRPFATQQGHPPVGAASVAPAWPPPFSARPQQSAEPGWQAAVPRFGAPQAFAQDRPPAPAVPPVPAVWPEPRVASDAAAEPESRFDASANAGSGAPAIVGLPGLQGQGPDGHPGNPTAREEAGGPISRSSSSAGGAHPESPVHPGTQGVRGAFETAEADEAGLAPSVERGSLPGQEGPWPTGTPVSSVSGEQPQQGVRSVPPAPSIGAAATLGGAISRPLDADALGGSSVPGAGGGEPPDDTGTVVVQRPGRPFDAAEAADEETIIVPRRSEPVWRLETDEGESFALVAAQVVVGRRPNGSEDGVQYLALRDGTKTLSKLHARLIRSPEGWTVTDLHSTNGVTLIDGYGVEELQQPGAAASVTDRMLLGRVGVRLVLGEAG